MRSASPPAFCDKSSAPKAPCGKYRPARRNADVDFVASRILKGAYVRIIVTGGAGFIGSHIVDAYVALGHDVLVIDSLWEHGGGRRENVSEKAQFIQADIRDATIEKIFADFQPEIVSHHAAQHSVAISSREPQYDADVNVHGLLNILDNSVKSGAKKVVFAGSGASFGDPEVLPMNEQTPQRPTSPY